MSAQIWASVLWLGASEAHGHKADRFAFPQISDVKAKIEKEKGWEASQQKLIYSGMSTAVDGAHAVVDMHCCTHATSLVEFANVPSRQDLARCQHCRVL
jgi:hypothetical protein